MSFEDAFYAVASVDSGLSAIQGTRVYPGALPTSPTLPASAYVVVTSVEYVAHDGGLSVSDVTAQIDAYGATYDAAKALRDAWLALTGQQFTTAYGNLNRVKIDQQAYDHDEDLQQHRFILNGRFIYNEN